MKKIFIILIFLMIAGTLPSQVKVNFSLQNPRQDQGKFVYDVTANIPASQQWKVGPTCIRIKYSTIPAGGLSVQEDNPAANANINLSGNASYGNMSTTSIFGDSAISLNILHLYQTNCFYLTTGTYTLGSVRWNIINPNSCINIIFLPYSAIFDSMTALINPTQWTGKDTGCVPIGINVQLINHTPTSYKLYQNYPNPFNPETRIRYDIPKTSNVQIIIFDALGREIETLVNQELRTGTYEVIWNAGNYSSGLYFYKIISDDFFQTNKMVLIK